MADIRRVSRATLTSTEILRELDTGTRVVIEVELLGRTMEMTVRKREETYYCDTPVKLLTYDSREEMRNCLERYRLARSDGDPEGSGLEDGDRP